ncbi:retinol dehydrogenase 5 [Aplysia californica]|uniref:Retinol dehydrogenase 5 n=1 Tax=Aplysia californica TaxID=6500 RepID=A0ABM0JY91_APLCA|nr:retinol dehydrogenase 5 [Aplysia californica]
MVELCAAVTGVYLGWVLLAVFPRKVVRLSWRIGQDLCVLAACSAILPWLLRHETVSAILVGVVGFLLYQDLPAPHLPAASKTVLITGCDTGLGHALALHLDQLGFTVFAGVLDDQGAGATSLACDASGRLVIVPLDITDTAQVKAAAGLVEQRLAGTELHGVVNNAGVLLLGAVEVMSAADARRIIDVNLQGLINVSRAFLPLLRRRRRTAARLVNVSSNVGLAPASQMGVYAASKAAVAMLTETWRYELRPMGIYVSMIVPSGFRTGIMAYDMERVAERWWSEASPEVKDYYGRDCFLPVNRTKNYKEYLNPDFSPLLSCMTDALLSRHPRPVYYKGLLARLLPCLYAHLSPALWTHAMALLADYHHFPVRALRQRDAPDSDSSSPSSSSSSSPSFSSSSSSMSNSFFSSPSSSASSDVRGNNHDHTHNGHNKSPTSAAAAKSD